MREGGKPYEGLPQLKPLQVSWIVVSVGVVRVFFITQILQLMVAETMILTNAYIH
jgi:hypothetical protein